MSIKSHKNIHKCPYKKSICDAIWDIIKDVFIDVFVDSTLVSMVSIFFFQEENFYSLFQEEMKICIPMCLEALRKDLKEQ
jgi:hypothetical protein